VGLLGGSIFYRWLSGQRRDKQHKSRNRARFWQYLSDDFATLRPGDSTGNLTISGRLRGVKFNLIATDYFD
jgi:hypothetical protein